MLQHSHSHSRALTHTHTCAPLSVALCSEAILFFVHNLILCHWIILSLYRSNIYIDILHALYVWQHLCPLLCRSFVRFIAFFNILSSLILCVSGFIEYFFALFFLLLLLLLNVPSRVSIGVLCVWNRNNNSIWPSIWEHRVCVCVCWMACNHICKDDTMIWPHVQVLILLTARKQIIHKHYLHSWFSLSFHFVLFVVLCRFIFLRLFFMKWD